MAHLESQRWVSKKRFQDVLPAALLFLRWAMRLYGSCAVELVPAYLLLAQANIGETRIETHMQKSTQCSANIKSLQGPLD